MNRTFEWGVVVSTFLSVLSIAPRHCARLTDFLHPKLRKINAVLITFKLPLPLPIPLPLITLTLRRLQRKHSLTRHILWWSSLGCRIVVSRHPVAYQRAKSCPGKFPARVVGVL